MEHVHLYLDNLHRRISQAISKLGSCIDPVLKECRIYPVLPSPVFLREIGSLLKDHDLLQFTPLYSGLLYDFRSTSGMPRFRDYDDLITPSSSSLNLYLTSLYEYVAPLAAGISRVKSVMKVSISTKSVFSRGISISASLSQSITLLQQQKARVVTFKDVVSFYHKATYTYLFSHNGPISEHPFIGTLLSLALSVDHASLLSNLAVLSTREPRPPPLIMSSKIYVARADNRAFCKDSDPVRALAGAIIQYSLDGPRGKRHLNPLLRSWYPATERNKLDRTWIIPHGTVAKIVFGDVSSFTNSGVNSWVGVLLLLLAISISFASVLNMPFAVEVSGSIVEVVLSDVLLVYLFSVVGCETFTKHGIHLAPGGSLGITGNNLLTMFSFVAVLIEYATKIRERVDLSGQLGGDDFVTIWISKSTDWIDIACATFRQSLNKYVGHLKEFNTIDVPQCGSFIVQDAFCKKSVMVTVSTCEGGRLLHLKSVEALPLMSTLILRSPGGASHLAFNQFKNSVASAIRYMEGAESLQLAYEYVYRQLYAIHGDVPRVSTSWIVPEGLLIETNSCLCSLAGEAIINSIPPRTLSTGLIVRKHFVERRNAAIRLNMLTIVMCGDPKRSAYIAPHEKSLLTILRTPVDTSSHPPLTMEASYLLELYLNAREDLSVYM